MWISHYYQTPAGVVFDTLVPSGVRAAAGTRQQNYYTPAPSSLDDSLVDALPSKQRSALAFLIAAARPMTLAQWTVEAGCTDGPIRQLIRKGLVKTQSRRELTHAPRMLRTSTGLGSGLIERLSNEQADALKTVKQAIDAGDARTLLLHGVTGSGKTEVYIRAIEHVVRFGRSAIVLVPEISLTPQTRARFESRFDSVAVLHSQMSPTERHYHWQRIRRGEVQVVVGPRSAVFAPLPRLGLIVIDEEHDASFKQDTQPRYHARRVAYQRAAIAKIPLLLGSATPSMESWHATRTGHAELISMPHRIADRPLPAVQLVDLRQRDQRTGGRDQSAVGNGDVRYAS